MTEVIAINPILISVSIVTIVLVLIGALFVWPLHYLFGDKSYGASGVRITTLEGKEVSLTCYYTWEMHSLDRTKCDLAGIK